MSGRDERIEEEARQLWYALHGYPPPAGLSGPQLLLHVLEQMERCGYERLGEAHARRRDITWPSDRRPN
jgi:hypothetical protein